MKQAVNLTSLPAQRTQLSLSHKWITPLQHLDNSIRYNINITHIQCRNADATCIDRINSKLITQAFNLCLAET